MLEDGILGHAESSMGPAGGSAKSKAKSRGKARPARVEKDAPSSNVSTPVPGDSKPPNELKGPFHELLPHKRIEEPMGNKTFSPRAVSWSPGGEWCVVVGDLGTICALSRWEEGGWEEGGL